MNPDKNYAMITLDKCGNIFVRNFLTANIQKGLNKKTRILKMILPINL